MRKPSKKTLSKHASVVGELGASKGGHARAATHTDRQLTKMARVAANARWSKPQRAA